jgi:hypothetical protein
MTSFERFFHLADRLGQVANGSPEADRIIHEALSREGPVLAYTSDKTAALLLLPTGFEWVRPTHAGGRIYAACARVDAKANGHPHPHHGQWGASEPLAMCGAVMRARAWLARG